MIYKIVYFFCCQRTSCRTTVRQLGTRFLPTFRTLFTLVVFFPVSFKTFYFLILSAHVGLARLRFLYVVKLYKLIVYLT